MNRRHLAPFSTLLIAAISIAGLARAEESTVGEVVVTAQKRAERTTDVPIALSVLGAEKIAALGLTDSLQIVNQTPGLSWGTTANKSKPFLFMRGVGNSDFQSGSNSPIGIYSDGAYQGNTFGFASLLMDLDRVEVLRGPQGTLWGKNTTGGLINYVPKLARVGQSANGDLSVSYGDFNAVNIQAAGGGPITDDLAGRAAFAFSRDDGMFHSSNPATFGRLGGSKWYAGRGSLAYEPTDAVKLVASVVYSDLEGQIRPAKSWGVYDPTKPFSFTPCASSDAGRPGTSCGDLLGYVSAKDPYTVAPSIKSIENVKNFSPTLKADIDVGEMTLSSITAYNNSRRDSVDDADFTPSNLYEYNLQDRFHSFSQELRLASPSGWGYNWMVGAYYYRDALQQYQAFNLPVFGNPSSANSFNNRSENYAIFSDGNVNLTSHWTVLGGLRVTRDTRTANGLAFPYSAAFGQLNTRDYALRNITSVTGDFSAGTQRAVTNLSGRLGVQYHFDKDSMAYVTLSRGFKGGDLNSGALVPEAFAITKPERLTAYEGGYKTSLYRSRLQFNIAGFYYDYADAQVNTTQSTSLVTVLSNAAKLRIYGLDGEIAAEPIDNLSVNLGFAYVDAKYRKYIGVGGVDYSGKTPTYTSKYQLNGTVDYRIPLGERGSVGLEADATYRARTFFTVANDARLGQAGYVLANASVAYYAPNQAWSVRGWVKNIADKVYYVGGFDFDLIGANYMLPGDRRSYGVTVSYTY